MLIISFFGSFWWLFPVTVVSVLWLFCKNEKRKAIVFALTMAVSPLISEGLKNLIKEVRPVNNLETSYSFPSGHALNSIVFYLLFLYFLRIKNKYLIWLVIIMIGLSRIFLGVHYWWDVVGGWVIGYGIFYFARLMYEVGINKDHRINSNRTNDGGGNNRI